MKKPLFLSLGALVVTMPMCVAAPAIALKGIKNAASYADPQLPNGAIAEGSIFNIFGSNMGPATLTYAAGLPLTTALSGTSVSVTIGGTKVLCFMIYTSAGQIAAILPSNTPVGTGTISVSYNDVASPGAPLTVAKSSFGIFTINQQGSGAGVIQDGSYRFNSTTFAFQPGQTVVLWGTGLGPLSSSDATTPPTGNLPGVVVTVTVGGIPANVTYAGRSGYSGDDQVAFTIPLGVTGCYVPVAVTVATSSVAIPVYSNFVTISVDSSTTCSSPSLPPISGASIRTGALLLDRSTSSIQTSSSASLLTTSDGLEAGFYKLPSSAFSPSYDLNYGQCAILNTPGVSVAPSPLDAGVVINVSGPNGSKQVPVTKGTGSFFAILGGGVPLPGQTANPLYLTPGSYAIDNGQGGTDVGPFSINVTVPGIFTWTNMSQITTIARNSSVTLTWTGGDLNSDLYISGGSGTAGGATVTFTCRAHDSDGTFTVPSSILQALPPSDVIGGIPLGSLQISSSNAKPNSSLPSGLDLFSYGDTQGGSKTGIAFQ